MAQQVDVYRDWLGIKATNRPLNHYQLLRLKLFEDDRSLIRKHYRKMNAHVRKYATGEFLDESQELLNELAKAMLCLTDLQRKREYDASLGRKTEVDKSGPKSLEAALLANGTVDQATIDKAKSLADAVNLDMHQALLQQKSASPDAVMVAYAESIGMPYLDLNDVTIDEEMIALMRPGMMRQYSCVPVLSDEDQLLMASPSANISPEIEDDIRLRLGKTVRTVLSTPAAVNAAIKRYFPPDAPEPTGRTDAKKPRKAASGAPRHTLTPEEREELTKQRNKVALVAFNFGFMAGAFGLFLTVNNASFVAIVGSGVLVGLAAAGVAFGVMQSRM